MENKYRVINDNYFSFEVFEDIFKAINERASISDDHTFKAGVASAEAAVRRVREQHYESITKIWQKDENMEQF
jgi:hypothetical protein